MRGRSSEGESLPATTRDRPLRSYQVAPFAAITVGAVASLVLIGWALDITALKHIRPSMASMKANSAISLVLAVFALWTCRSRPTSVITQLLAAALGVLSGLTLFEYLAGVDLHIDQALFIDTETMLANFPGRMAPATAMTFLLVSLSLLLLDSCGRSISRYFAVAVTLIGSAALTGYLYSVEALYSIFPLSSIALHTALSFFLLGAGILFSRPTRGFMSVVTSEHRSAAMVRQLLPSVVVVLVLSGWLSLSGAEAGLYPSQFGFALLAVTNVFIVALLVTRAAQGLNKADGILEKSEERYRILFENNPQPMCLVDLESRSILEANEAALTLYGYSVAEFQGLCFDDLEPSDPVYPITETQPGSPDDKKPQAHQRKDGSLVIVEIKSNEIRHDSKPALLMLVTDVTEKRRLELRLLQAQKMEAIGQLAGGVAHDFNNLICVIQVNCDLLWKESQLEPQGQRRLEQITRAAASAEGLTCQLLAIGRKQEIQSPVVFELNDLVGELARMLQGVLGKEVHMVTRLGEAAGRVRAGPGQLEQVILNLVINARDAMPHGGQLTLETRASVLDESYTKTHPNVKPGEFVQLTITDTGSGMEPRTLAQVFEPFFTTKPPGKGTGLGLATAYGIIQQNNGHVAVYSEPNQGTTFSVYLPKVETESEPLVDIANQATEGGNETVLVLEDNEDLRMLICETLARAGYRVLESSTPHEAIAVASGYQAPIHLVLSDIFMRDGRGPQIVGQIRKERPGIRAIFMSGYSGEALGRQGSLQSDFHFLQKPFSVNAVRLKIREVLDQDPASHGELSTPASEDSDSPE